jgi:hypothetical protein
MALLSPGGVPVVACRRSDWPLRREAAALLEQAHAAEVGAGGGACADIASSLVFLCDVEAACEPLGALCARGRLALTLVDHNSAWGPFRALGGAVAAIVDHHADAGAHAHVTPPARQVSFDAAAGRGGVGSACTLVAAHALRGGGAPPALLDSLLAVILLDTSNLCATAGVATPADAAAVDALCAALGGRSRADRDAAYARLTALRYDAAWTPHRETNRSCNLNRHHPYRGQLPNGRLHARRVPRLSHRIDVVA